MIGLSLPKKPQQKSALIRIKVDAINKKIAKVVLFIGMALSVLMLTTKLIEQPWFIFLFFYGYLYFVHVVTD